MVKKKEKVKAEVEVLPTVVDNKPTVTVVNPAPAKDPLKEILEIFEQSPLPWGKYYFPHHFRSASPPFHMKLIHEAMKNRYLAVQCPRESAKSTLLSFLYPTHQITFKKKRFIVIVQNTYAKAVNTLETIKNEFRHTQRLKKDYKVKIHRDLAGDSILIHPCGFKTRILCKGSEQIGSIRGEKFGAYRPDLILIDDLEDDDMVRNPERRQVLQSLFDDALIPAGDRETCQYIIIGTILHDDCLMAKLVSADHYKEYRKLFYIALGHNTKTGELQSLWKEKWTVKDLLDMQKIKPEVFAKEYQGDPVSGSLRKFDKKDYRRWYIEEDEYILTDEQGRVISRGKLSDCRAGIGCDLAWEEKKSSDFTVLIPGYLTPNSDLLVDDYFCERGVRPDQLEEMLFTMEKQLVAKTGKTVYIGMEKGKIEKIMQWCMTQAMKRRNYYLNFKTIPWVHDKISRIVLPLQPRYKLHSIYHKSGMGELEYQLTRIPAGTHDDLPDALQMLVRTLDYAPPKPKEEMQEDDPHFSWLMKQIKEKKIRAKAPYVFGQKKAKPFPFQTTISWR